MKHLLILIAIQALGQKAGPDPARVLSQYREALARLEAMSLGPLRAEAMQTVEMSWKDKPPREWSTVVRYAFADGKAKVVTVSESGEGVDIQDNDVMYALGKAKGKSHFSVSYAGELGAHKFGKYLDKLLYYVARSPFSLYPALPFSDLSRFVGGPDFVMRGVDRIGAEGDELIRISFDRIPPQSSGETMFSGWVVVSPAAGWRLREYEVRTGQGDKAATWKGSVDYVTAVDGLVLPSKVVGIESIANGFSVKTTVEFQKYGNQPIPAGEFTLDSYGLGDFRPLARGNFNMASFVLFGVAAATFGLGVLLRYRGRNGRKEVDIST